MTTWREILPQLVQSGTYRTQGALLDALETQTGQRVNQATVSRELTTLGARKMDGFYRLPSSRRAGANIYSIKSTNNGCLLVVKTDNAFASVVANLIDGAQPMGVLGTIAGDDTVFVATTGPEALGPLCDLLGWDPSAGRRRRS